MLRCTTHFCCFTVYARGLLYFYFFFHIPRHVVNSFAVQRNKHGANFVLLESPICRVFNHLQYSCGWTQIEEAFNLSRAALTVVGHITWIYKFAVVAEKKRSFQGLTNITQLPTCILFWKSRELCSLSSQTAAYDNNWNVSSSPHFLSALLHLRGAREGEQGCLRSLHDLQQTGMQTSFSRHLVGVWMWCVNDVSFTTSWFSFKDVWTAQDQLKDMKEVKQENLKKSCIWCNVWTYKDNDKLSLVKS